MNFATAINFMLIARKYDLRDEIYEHDGSYQDYSKRVDRYLHHIEMSFGHDGYNSKQEQIQSVREYYMSYWMKNQPVESKL